MNLKATIFLAILGLSLAKPQLPKDSEETISDKVTPMPPGELDYDQGPIRKPGVLPEVDDAVSSPVSTPEAEVTPDPTPAESDSDKDDADGDSTSSDATKDITTITPKPETTTTEASTTTTAKTTTTSSTTPKPTTTSTKAPMTSTQAPAPRGGGGGFSGWSFFGGIVVTLVGLACGFIGMKYYKTRQAGGNGNYSSFR